MNTKMIGKEKAISPIIATLLLILIAIAAGVVVYAYVIGFIGNSTSNSGATTNTLSIDQATFSSKASNFPVVAYVRNEGPSTESFNTGFFVKGSSLNDQLSPAILVSVSSGALSIGASSAVSLSYSSASVLTVSIAGLSCSSATSATVAAFGTSNSVTCSTTPTTQTTTLTITSATFTSTFIATTTTSASTMSSVAIGIPVTAGAILVSINNVFDFTLSPAGAQATAVLQAGQTYTIQVTGTDGGSAVASAKAS